MGTKNVKHSNKNNNSSQKEIKKKYQKEKYYEWNMEYCNNFDLNNGKIELKTKINKNVKNFDIFPNGNILIYDEEVLTIYKSKTFKPIFNYANNQIKNIIILSNNNLLLYCSEQDYYSIFNISKTIKEIKINFKYEIDYINSISFVKLNNNNILFYYTYRNEKTMGYRNAFFYYFCFYYYDKEKSNLIKDYEDTQFLEFRGNFLPYEKSFFYYGNDSLFVDSNITTYYTCIDFYHKKKKK